MSAVTCGFCSRLIDMDWELDAEARGHLTICERCLEKEREEEELLNQRARAQEEE